MRSTSTFQFWLNARIANAISSTWTGMISAVTKSGGDGCSGTSPFPVFSPWASTGMLAHTSPSFALSDFQAVLTPEATFDYDYTTRWSLSPG